MTPATEMVDDRPENLTRRPLATAIVWIVALAGLAGAGTLAGLFALMATSLDPIQAINAGVEPWLDAVYAALVFLGIAASTILALAAWHSRRFQVPGVLLACLQTGLVIWAALRIYAEYF